MVICCSDYKRRETLLKYQRKGEVNRLGQFSEERLQEAVKRIQAGEIGKTEAERYYGISARTSCFRIASVNLKKKWSWPTWRSWTSKR
jgi:hypothetical protein